MKKFFLSAGVIIAFFIYSWHQRDESQQAQVVSPTPHAMSTQTSSIATPPPATPTPQQAGHYKDGSYAGSVADTIYGNMQVQAVISGGKLTDVLFLQYPNDRSTSVDINTQAIPYLKQEAITAQNANVDIVTGATDSSI